MEAPLINRTPEDYAKVCQERDFYKQALQFELDNGTAQIDLARSSGFVGGVLAVLLSMAAFGLVAGAVIYLF